MKPLRAWRSEKLMSVRELADVTGVAPKTITDIEYGRSRASFAIRRQIADALSVEPLEIAEFAADISRSCAATDVDGDD